MSLNLSPYFFLGWSAAAFTILTVRLGEYYSSWLGKICVNQNSFCFLIEEWRQWQSKQKHAGTNFSELHALHSSTSKCSSSCLFDYSWIISISAQHKHADQILNALTFGVFFFKNNAEIYDSWVAFYNNSTTSMACYFCDIHYGFSNIYIQN